MPSSQRLISLGFCPEQVPEGQHICYIFNDDAERRNIMGRYFEAGLAQGEKLLYLVDETTPALMLQILAEVGVNARSKPAALTVAEAAAGYCPSGGKFNASEMLDAVGDFYLAATGEGYPGARGTGEMSWCLVEGRADPEELMEYEARLTDVLQEYPYTACCQYDARRFDGETIMDVLSVHPLMIVRGQLVRNPYFVPAAVFLKEYRERRAFHNRA